VFTASPCDQVAVLDCLELTCRTLHEIFRYKCELTSDLGPKIQDEDCVELIVNLSHDLPCRPLLRVKVPERVGRFLRSGCRRAVGDSRSSRKFPPLVTHWDPRSRSGSASIAPAPETDRDSRPTTFLDLVSRPMPTCTTQLTLCYSPASAMPCCACSHP
jgi:hypothetical protein